MQTAQIMRPCAAPGRNHPAVKLSAWRETARPSNRLLSLAARKRIREAAIIAIVAKLSEDAEQTRTALGEFSRQAIQKNGMLVQVERSLAKAEAKVREALPALKWGASGH